MDIVDVSKVIGKNYIIIHEKLNASSVPPDLHIKPAAITPDDLNSTEAPGSDLSNGNFTEVTISTEVVSLHDKEPLKHPNHPYSNCSKFYQHSLTLHLFAIRDIMMDNLFASSCI